MIGIADPLDTRATKGHTSPFVVTATKQSEILVLQASALKPILGVLPHEDSHAICSAIQTSYNLVMAALKAKELEIDTVDKRKEEHDQMLENDNRHSLGLATAAHVDELGKRVNELEMGVDQACISAQNLRRSTAAISQAQLLLRAWAKEHGVDVEEAASPMCERVSSLSGVCSSEMSARKGTLRGATVDDRQRSASPGSSVGSSSPNGRRPSKSVAPKHASTRIDVKSTKLFDGINASKPVVSSTIGPCTSTMASGSDGASRGASQDDNSRRTRVAQHMQRIDESRTSIADLNSRKSVFHRNDVDERRTVADRRTCVSSANDRRTHMLAPDDVNDTDVVQTVVM